MTYSGHNSKLAIKPLLHDTPHPLAGESSQAPTTMRQTQLCVIPNCAEIAKFHPFDVLVQSINQARRSARDFVIEKKVGTGSDWV